MIVNLIILVGTLRNVWRSVCRVCILSTMCGYLRFYNSSSLITVCFIKHKVCYYALFSVSIHFYFIKGSYWDCFIMRTVLDVVYSWEVLLQFLRCVNQTLHFSNFTVVWYSNWCMFILLVVINRDELFQPLAMIIYLFLVTCYFALDCWMGVRTLKK